MLSSTLQEIKISNDLFNIKSSEGQNEIRISKTINELENMIKDFQVNDHKSIFSGEETNSIEDEFKKSSNFENPHQFFKTTLEPNDINFLKLTLQENNSIIEKTTKKKNILGKKIRSKTKSLFNISKKISTETQKNNYKFKPKSQNKKKSLKIFNNNNNNITKKNLSAIHKKNINKKNLNLPRQSNGLLLKQRKTFPKKKKLRKLVKKDDFDKFSHISSFSLKT